MSATASGHRNLSKWFELISKADWLTFTSCLSCMSGRSKGVVSYGLPVVLITGALTGIGRATALAFAQEGARVVVSGRHDDAGQKLATELHTLGAEAEFVRTDVRHEDEVKNLVDKT